MRPKTTTPKRPPRESSDPPSRADEMRAALAGEARRCAGRAAEITRALEQVASAAYDAAVEVRADASPEELGRVGQSLHGAALHGAALLAELERVAGRLGALESLGVAFEADLSDHALEVRDAHVAPVYAGTSVTAGDRLALAS